METAFKNTREGKVKRLRLLNEKLREQQEYAERYTHAWRITAADNSVSRLKEAIAFVEVDRVFTLDLDHPSKMFVVADKFWIVPRTRAWRQKGKTTWYLYKNPEQFVRRYVFRENIK
jgi:hypothetical protein